MGQTFGKQLNLVVLAQALECSSSQDYGWVGSHLKDWPGLENQLLRWLIHTAIGSRLQSLFIGLLEHPHKMATGFPNSKTETSMYFMAEPQKSYIVISAIFYWLHKSAQSSVEDQKRAENPWLGVTFLSLYLIFWSTILNVGTVVA